jgi:dTDP-4-dehydrorhamnose reductase
VVGDQVGAPTYAPHLAQVTFTALSYALRMDVFPSGTYHVAPEGEVSWHGFAVDILAAARRKGVSLKLTRVEPVSTGDYPTAARRPLNSRLDTTKLRTVLGIQLPTWRDGLDACLDEWMEANR